MREECERNEIEGRAERWIELWEYEASPPCRSWAAAKMLSEP